MSFKVILLGIVGMFGSFILFALAFLNMMPLYIYMIASVAIGIVMSLTLAIIAILLNGVMGPFLSAKSGGHVLISALTASGNFKFLSGRERSGITETKLGYFMTPPRSIGSWPNGVKGGFAYWKYGSTLEPKFVKATSVMKENNINDIDELDAVATDMKQHGKDLVIRLD